MYEYNHVLSSKIVRGDNRVSIFVEISVRFKENNNNIEFFFCGLRNCTYWKTRYLGGFRLFSHSVI